MHWGFAFTYYLAPIHLFYFVIYMMHLIMMVIQTGCKRIHVTVHPQKFAPGKPQCASWQVLIIIY